MSETEEQIDKGIVEVSAAILTGGLSEEAAAGGKLLEAGLKALTASGLFASGTFRIITTAAGANPKEVDEAAGTVTTLTNPAGAAVTAVTGDTKKGEKAADLASGISLAAHPSEALKNPADATLTVSSVVKDVKSAYSTVKNWLTTPPPPPPPPPPGPQTRGGTPAPVCPCTKGPNGLKHQGGPS